MANPEIQQQSCCSIEIDEEWVKSLENKARDACRNHRAEKCTIFKVPQRIRKQDPDAYEPKIISLGPYHRSKPCLQAMNELKLHFLSLFLHRKPSVALQDYIRKLKTLEEEARSSYSEDIDMESNEFVEMLLLDGCFVVEFLLQYPDGGCRHPFFKTLGASTSIMEDMLMLENQLPFFVLESICDPTEIEGSKSLKDLAFDLCESLFSNSIRVPFKEEEPVPSFHHLLHFFHSCLAPAQDKIAHSDTPTPESNPQTPLLAETGVKFRTTEEVDKSFYHSKHFLHPESSPHTALLAETGVKFRTTEEVDKSFFDCYHLKHFLHSCIASTQHQQQKNAKTPTPESIPCAILLAEAGVNFRTTEEEDKCFLKSMTIKKASNPELSASSTERVPEQEAKSLLDITFKNGVLSIPTLKIYDETNLLFRNLIAFEQCFPAAGNHVAAYSAFMDAIIDTRMDVVLLCRKKVIVNCLGSNEEVAVLFNNLCNEVTVDFDTCYLSVVLNDVTRHCDSRWHRYRQRWHKYRQKLKEDYFNSPWSIISLLAAVILLLLTVIQTVFSVLPYFKPPK